jgi:hypothetical protein
MTCYELSTKPKDKDYNEITQTLPLKTSFLSMTW